ncbi:activin receptor type-1-like [Odontomachus brunneus]|uniref:activin receptor type-1-like n=1 Tax=Odontomachus brunneus TaxID=486640 RepID=UPI0013F26637|nr:activin receptor type-1-like [Odontomachus brunneus]
MADVIFITHFVLLLTFKLCTGEEDIIALQEHDIPFDNEESNLSEPLDRNFGSSTIGQKHIKCHVCEDAECSPPDICDNAIICWKSRVRQVDGTEYVKRGCYTSEDHRMLTCNREENQNAEHAEGHIRNLRGGAQYSVECCQEDFCNVGPYPVLHDSNNSSRGYYVLKLTFAILGSVAGLFIAGGFLLCLLTHRLRRKESMAPHQNELMIDSDIEPSMLHFSFPSSAPSASYHPHELRATAAGDSTLKEYLDGRSLTSGSGSGLPLLVQRTLAKQVALVECLSNGSSGFGGEVWRGVWHGESVAVKIYFSRDEAAWARETEVYSELLPSRHDNILGYVGSDMTSRGSCTQLWLVTHYHQLGSLFEHLNRSPHPLTHHQTLNICVGIANGLLYLHTEIHGTRGKPAMAHRNLKSKNILVKTNGGCVIADFALATTQDRLSAERVDLRQGTKRYMSPEILEQTMNVECLESFRRADVYSLGLILWEVCLRCISNGVVLEYAMPYSEWLSSSNQEPSIEEMRKLVVFDQRRPPLPNRWHSDPTLAGMGKLMRECWHGKPAARLPILRVKKTLVKLAASDSRVHLPLD